MPEIRLRRDREPDLVVEEAALLGEVSSRAPGRTRWTELRVWRSGAGALIAEQVGKSEIEGERDRCRAWVCKDQAEVVERLGRGWLSHELFQKLGFDDSERVK